MGTGKVGLGFPFPRHAAAPAALQIKHATRESMLIIEKARQSQKIALIQIPQ